jgi:hypothetical protein
MLRGVWYLVTQTTTVLGLIGAFAVSGAAEVRAQQPSPAEFINFNVGAQPQRRTINTSESFSVYDESATVTSNQPIKNGVVFDVSGGHRIWRRVALGVGLSSFRSRGDAGVVASIPDPAYFDRPRIVTGNTSGLDRSELGVHLQAVWRTPVTDKTDVSISAGPSFIRVTQQVATASLRAGTQNIDVTQKDESGTALGVNVGFDGSYMFQPQFGAGVFLRYAGGSVDLPAVSNVKVGGFQGGFGLRVRF